jgi:TonB family protein
MNAEAKRVSRPEVWTRWEGQVVKGVFPLRRFLGGSDQSAVFLSQYDTGKLIDVAIKIVPAVAAQAEARLAHWRTAAALSHRNLVRLFDMGRCQLGGREFVFVVMEYGEQTLAQFLSQRALTAGEVRALLLPTLDALAFLHTNQLVHAQLKPSNFLVVADQLKLASDSVRPVGHRGLSSADDIWSVGMTLLEAFTQRTPMPDEQHETSSLLTDVPAPFSNMVRRCLNPNAANRPSIAELQTQFESAPKPDVNSEDGPQAHPVLLAIPAVLLFSLAVWIAMQPSRNLQANLQPPALQPPAVPAPAAPAPSSASRPTRAAPIAKPAPQPTSTPAESRPQPTRTVADTSGPVVLEVIPDVPRALRQKIQGRILVTVRVLVDTSGDVMAAMIEKPGPNRNLANLADDAARKWKFVTAESSATRVWILTFAFTEEGVTARAAGV